MISWLISAWVMSPLGLTEWFVQLWFPFGLGGDSRRLQSQLVNVQQLSSTKAAFGAIRADGSVITWGSPRAGGDTWLTEKHVNDNDVKLPTTVLDKSKRRRSIFGTKTQAIR